MENIICSQIGICNCSRNDDRSTCGSLILLFSAASKLSRSHDNNQTMIRDRMIRPRSSKDHHNQIRSQAPPSPGQLCPYCHHNAMVFPTGLEVTFPVLVLEQERRQWHVLRPPSPTGNCLIWLKQATTGANAVHIYTATHTCIYIIRCIYIHSTHTHTQRHSFIKARTYTQTGRHKYKQTRTSKHWRHSCAIENIYSHTCKQKCMLT